MYVYIYIYVCIYIYIYISRLMVVSCAAKQISVCDTTMCYIHEQSILIECSPESYCKILPYEETTRVTETTCNHLVCKTNTK